MIIGIHEVQVTDDKIEMTQNQVYGAREAVGGDIVMKANVVYGVNESSS